MLRLLTTAIAVALYSTTTAALTFVGTGKLIVTTYGTNTRIGCLNAEGQWTSSTCALYTGTKVNSAEYKLSTSAGYCLVLGEGSGSSFGCVTGQGYENWQRDPANPSILTYGHVSNGPFYGSPPGNPSTLYLENSGGLTEVQLQWQPAK